MGAVAIKNARAVTPGGITDGATIVTRDGLIHSVSAGDELIPDGADIVDAGGDYVGPGFVDIHCHGGGKYMCHENPAEVGRYFLKKGTTSMLMSVYHNISRTDIERGAHLMRQAIEAGSPGNIVGLHMEGPFFSKLHGAMPETARNYSREEYDYITSTCGDLIGQWTFSPGIEGDEQFADIAISDGYTLAMGHCAASYEKVFDMISRGVNICTHLGDATGSAYPESRYFGTKEMDFDSAILLSDAYAEIICDSEGAHVRPEMLKLYFKVKGPDRLMIITDSMPGRGEDSPIDVNMTGGVLNGSWLTMDRACANMRKHTGASVCDIFKMASTNPAKVIGLEGVGRLEAGARANIVVVDEEFNIKHVVLDGKIAV